MENKKNRSSVKLAEKNKIRKLVEKDATHQLGIAEPNLSRACDAIMDAVMAVGGVQNLRRALWLAACHERRLEEELARHALETIFEKDLSALGLPRRTENALRKWGDIKFVWQLLWLDRGKLDRTRGIGRSGQATIRKIMAGFGLKFSPSGYWIVA